MSKLELFKSLISKEFYIKNKHKLSKDIFPEDLHELYEALEVAHDKQAGDIKLRDIYAIFEDLNPTATQSYLNSIQSIFRSLRETEALSPSIAEEVFKRALIEHKATRIAQIALEIAHGKHEDWIGLETMMKEDVTKEDIEFTTTDLAELTKQIEANYKWRFNLKDLDAAVGPIGPEMFIVMAAPVNAGKTAMGINFAFGPDGFASQGAKCLYVGNEDPMKKIVMRIASCYTGLTRQEIIDDPESATQVFNNIRSHCFPVSGYGMSFSKLSYIMDKVKPDILVVDMLDKLQVQGDFSEGNGHHKLEYIYEQARELAKKHQCAIFGLSQTSAESFGKLYYSFDKLAGSKVGKGANADLVLLLGKQNNGEFASENAAENNFRVINIAKSKDEGDGKKIQCQIIPHLSRITA